MIYRIVTVTVAATFLTSGAQAQSPSPSGELEAQANPPPTPPKPGPIKQSLGDGTIGLLLQSWFYATDDSRFSAGASSPSFSPAEPGHLGLSTFRLRRVEISYDGQLGEIFKYRAMIDPSIIWNGPVVVTGSIPAGSTSFRSNPVTTRDILQDAWFGVALPYTEIRMGQFKIPLTMEGFSTSSGKLDFAERAFLSRTFGDQRDIGLMVSSDSKLPYVEYEVGVFNGRGKNVLATGPSKDVVGRIVGKPYKGISIGGSGYLGRTWDSGTLSYRQKNRAGVEAAVEMFGATVKFEYMVGRELINTSQGPGKTSPTGYYVTAGYRLPMYEVLQVIGRYDHWDSDSNTGKSSCVPGAPLAGDGRCSKYSAFTVGVNYDFLANVLNGAKLQLDYYRDNDDVQSVGANEVFLVGQVKF